MPKEISDIDEIDSRFKHIQGLYMAQHVRMYRVGKKYFRARGTSAFEVTFEDTSDARPRETPSIRAMEKALLA